MKNRARTLFAAGLFVAASLVGNRAAGHASSGLHVRVDDCDAGAYPRIVCRVVVRDANGKFIDDLSDRAFTASFDEQAVAAVRATLTETIASKSQLLLVLDDGLTHRGKYGRTWRASAEALISAMPPGHGVAAILASQAYEGLAPTVGAAADDRLALVDTVRSHALTPHARLYDAVCDAAARVPFSGRTAMWIAIVSDGLDRGGTVCDARQASQAVVRSRAPVLVIGIGPYAGELRGLAAESNGVFVAADDIEAVAQAADSVMRRARRQYAVEFVVDRPADGREHAVAIGVRVGGATAHDAVDVEASPLAPVLLGFDWSSGGIAVSAGELPMRGLVRVEPRFVGRGASAAEFVLDGMRTRVDVPPFAYEFDAAALSHEAPGVLSVTLYGGAGESVAASQLVVGVAPEGTAAAYRLDPTGAGVRAWLAGSAASLATGTVSALLLGAGLAVVMRRPRNGWTWRRSVRHETRIAADVQPADDAVTLVQPTVASTGCSVRLRIQAPGGASYERVLHGPAVLGRGADGIHSDIPVASSYVSVRHARFAPDGAGWRVEDLHSVNGVRCNGRMLAPGVVERIAVGDCIQCADVRIDVEGMSPGGVDRSDVVRG
jgi:hypothetical protein